jgi:hypothetical protein
VVDRADRSIGESLGLLYLDPQMWTAVVAMALLFRAGHIPATATLLPLTPWVIARPLVLNGIGGVVERHCGDVGASDRRLSSLMTEAEAPHVVQLHVGPYDQPEVDRCTAERPEVAHQQMMLMLGVNDANLFFSTMRCERAVPSSSKFRVASEE